MTKTCRKCSKTKSVVEFHKSHINKKGQQYKLDCRDCHSKYMAQYREEHAEEFKIYSEKYKENNRQKTRDVAKQYYYNNKAKSLKYMSKWKSQNKEKWEVYSKEYFEKNKQYKQEQIKTKATEVQGVYALYDKGECLYVGESSWLNHRLYLHKSYTRKPSRNKAQRGLYEILHKNHPNFICGIVEETPNHKEREHYYINKLKPLYNGRM